MHKKTTIIKGISALLLANMLAAGSAFAATSTIVITSTPLLAFNDIPDSGAIDSITVPTSDQEVTSDNDGQLASSKYLEVRDTRGCGGFSLTLGADTFLPLTSPELRDNLRVITNEDDAATGSSSGGVKYLTGFTGTQGVTAPLNVNSTTYTDPNLFTDSPFDVTDNILDNTLTLLGGNLTAPGGRTGTMHIGLSFYIIVPKYFPPNATPYYTTLTYTLADDTTGSC